ncbi:Hypothetical protein ORPV_488 [Orpheovirus IHUMI-LCC2]|uniref:Uncharacterized protein n=1 Tax=Orpheovirus IHUMI-LCC2 TaxID=2023057 RepID=A0A2I2L4B5_9VIRU|nr:Hypothetical protein ORPV_488 [Orpheovirus IHUMI-LCC2]SNW62392.1 Hypothetical protein ORPV_488 [Orpheovirus IHUMI-LCC2]
MNIPSEILTLIANSQPIDILNLCSSSRQFRDACNTEYFRNYLVNTLLSPIDFKNTFDYKNITTTTLIILASFLYDHPYKFLLYVTGKYTDNIFIKVFNSRKYREYIIKKYHWLHINFYVTIQNICNHLAYIIPIPLSTSIKPSPLRNLLEDEIVDIIHQCFKLNYSSDEILNVFNEGVKNIDRTEVSTLYKKMLTLCVRYNREDVNILINNYIKYEVRHGTRNTIIDRHYTIDEIVDNICSDNPIFYLRAITTKEYGIYINISNYIVNGGRNERAVMKCKGDLLNAFNSCYYPQEFYSLFKEDWTNNNEKLKMLNNGIGVQNVTNIVELISYVLGDKFVKTELSNINYGVIGIQTTIDFFVKLGDIEILKFVGPVIRQYIHDVNILGVFVMYFTSSMDTMSLNSIINMNWYLWQFSLSSGLSIINTKEYYKKGISLSNRAIRDIIL